jgi:hypothetical protein
MKEENSLDLDVDPQSSKFFEVNEHTNYGGHHR